MPSSSGSSKIIYLICRQQYSKKNDIHYKFRTEMWFTMLTSRLILNLNLNVIEMKYIIQHNFLAQKLIISSSKKHKLNILFLNQVQNAYTTRTVASLVKTCDLRFPYFVSMHSILPYRVIF
jgi:hypothetical protein